ncbi:DUF3331 domain-containing protein [Caballeronia sp. GAFFF1]|uniref:DUF3331 domain-containing protein n=1 Tax=Caballeronia sp. GAFFF1 TaxID=2921779 RepID=UPI00202801C6|nr:DUF3331 domain-containing protein [Caballeronia sp. GAFFF1]
MMSTDASIENAWTVILSRLSARSDTMRRMKTKGALQFPWRGGYDSTHHAAIPDALQHTGQTATIKILDLAERAVIVSWHDSTSCHYDYQKWFKAKARKTGICALSGREIHRGAYVFRPSQAHRPVNSESMILASAVEAELLEAGHLF